MRMSRIVAAHPDGGDRKAAEQAEADATSPRAGRRGEECGGAGDAGEVHQVPSEARDADHVHFGGGQSEGTIYLEPGVHELCLGPATAPTSPSTPPTP